MGEVIVALSIRLCSTSSSAPMAMTYPTDFTTVVLQVINRSNGGRIIHLDPIDFWLWHCQWNIPPEGILYQGNTYLLHLVVYLVWFGPLPCLPASWFDVNYDTNSDTRDTSQYTISSVDPWLQSRYGKHSADAFWVSGATGTDITPRTAILPTNNTPRTSVSPHTTKIDLIIFSTSHFYTPLVTNET